jgi:hypothetical protein
MTYTISTDKARLDIALIHRVLSASYWAEGRTLETVEASVGGSLCFGVYGVAMKARRKSVLPGSSPTTRPSPIWRTCSW